jgi:hypothetical protein
MLQALPVRFLFRNGSGKRRGAVAAPAGGFLPAAGGKPAAK